MTIPIATATDTISTACFDGVNTECLHTQWLGEEEGLISTFSFNSPEYRCTTMLLETVDGLSEHGRMKKDKLDMRNDDRDFMSITLTMFCYTLNTSVSGGEC